MERIEYPLSPKYISNWSVEEALRELIANALDADSRPNISWKNDEAIICDKAPGIPRSFWVLGEGEHGEIGQFGEGLKMAMLVLAREGRYCSVETVGYSVIPSIEWSDVYQAKVMVLQYTGNSRKEGTKIAISCAQREFEAARNRFLKLIKVNWLDKKQGILGMPGTIFINGVYVQTINALYGYNFTDKKLANRDRSILDGDQVVHQICQKLGQTRKEFIIRGLLDKAARTNEEKQGGVAEFSAVISNMRRSFGVWRHAFYDLFGKRACLSAGTELDRQVHILGWNIILLPYSVQYILHRSGIKDSGDVWSKLAKEKPRKLNTKLSKAEKEVLNASRHIAALIVPQAEIKQVRVVESFPHDSNACELLGLYRNKIVYLKREILSDLAVATGVVCHEFLHDLGFQDGTVAFELKMTEIIGKLATKNKLN